MSQPSFIKNITVRIALTIPLRFRGLIVLPLLTRLYPQDIYGVWLQVILITEILNELLSLRLGTALVRYLSAESDQKSTIKAVFTITLCCSLTFILLVWIFGNSASQLIFGNPDFKGILKVASFWILIQACMRIGLDVLRSQERISTLSIRELLSALWMICAVSIAYLFELQIGNLILICLAGDALLLVWILMQIGVAFPLISIQQSIIVARKFFSYSAPLIINTFFLWFTFSVDRFLLIQLLGLSPVGIYGVTFQVASLMLFVLKPINFVLFPRASRAWNQGEKDDVNRYFSQAITLTLILSLPLIVGIFMTSDGLIQLLAGESYLAGKALIFWLLLSCLASMVYQNHLYVIHLIEKTSFLPILFICTAVLNLLIGYLLVSTIGLFGAAISRALTFILMATVVTIWAQRHVKFHINWSIVLRVGLASLVMGLALNWVPMDSWRNLIAKILTGGGIFVLSIILLRVLNKENLMMLKSQF